MTLDVFAARSARPAGLALIGNGVHLHYEQLAQRVETVCTSLAARGALDAGPRPVGLVAETSLWAIERLLALASHGIPVLLLHPRSPAAEHARYAERAGARCTLTPNAEVPVLSAERPPKPASIDAATPFAIVPTSGSTGAPRLVVLSRGAIEASAAASARRLPLTADDRWLLCLPLAHVGGLSIVTRSLLARSTVVLFQPGPEGLLRGAPALAAQLREHGVTLLSLVPTVLDALLAHDVKWRPPPSLRAVLVGGAALSSALLSRARERGLNVVTTYGLTEACSQVTASFPGSMPPLQRGIVSAGKPLPGVEVRFTRDQRLALRGPTLCSGFADADPPFDADGWLLTDDLGWSDESGFLYVAGRASDRIVTGGENVDPSAVEAALESLPGVRQACVFGIDDERFGEIVACAIVNEQPFDGVGAMQLLNERLAPHQRPRCVAWLQELPRTASGKVDRKAARNAAEALLEPWPETTASAPPVR